MKVEISGHCNQFDQQQLLSLINKNSETEPARPKRRSFLALWFRRHRQRRQMARELAAFTDEVLKDFGLTRAEATRLAHRPFWRA